MSVIDTCIVLNLQVGVWLGYRLDKATTRKVTEEADAASDAARVNKHLIPRESIADIVGAVSAIRNHFYSKTLPWKDNGDRLLTRKIYMQFIEEHSNLVSGFNKAVKDFLERKYLGAKEQAEFRMGVLFDLGDYPSMKELSKKFYVHMDIDGVAPTYDIRLRDDAGEMQARVTRAMEGLWLKLAKPLQHLTEKLSDENAVFRNATISNLKDTVAIIPELNFTDDPKLEKIRQEIETKLAVYEPDDLRKDKKVRAAVATEAQEIMDQMKGFMTGLGITFGGDDNE